MSEKPQRDGIFVAWIHENSRSSGLAEALGLDPVFMPWASPHHNLPMTVFGWFRSALRTLRSVRRVAPGGMVAVMTPPPWTVLVTVLAARQGVRVVVDMHSGARDAPQWRWSWRLLQWLLRRRVDAVVVTNEEILEGGRLGGCRPVVIVDPSLIGAPQETDRTHTAKEPIYGVFPASGAYDEPIGELAAAAEMLDGATIKVTGHPPEWINESALEVTGFLSKGAYEDLLSGASFVLALTTAPATNQRAASEATQRGIPVVCSDTTMLRSTYDGAGVFVTNEARSIVEGIRSLLADRDSYVQGAIGTRRRLRTQALDGIDSLNSP